MAVHVHTVVQNGQMYLMYQGHFIPVHSMHNACALFIILTEGEGK